MIFGEKKLGDEPVKWCCHYLQQHFEACGARGFSVFVSTKDELEPAFVLQYRSLNPGAKVPYTDSPMTLVTDAYIDFVRGAVPI